MIIRLVFLLCHPQLHLVMRGGARGGRREGRSAAPLRTSGGAASEEASCSSPYCCCCWRCQKIRSNFVEYLYCLGRHSLTQAHWSHRALKNRTGSDFPSTPPSHRSFVCPVCSRLLQTRPIVSHISSLLVKRNKRGKKIQANLV